MKKITLLFAFALCASLAFAQEQPYQCAQQNNCAFLVPSESQPGGIGSFFSNGLVSNTFGVQTNQPLAAVANTTYAVRFSLRGIWAINRVACSLQTTAAGGFMGFGIYNSTGTVKLFDSGPISTAVAGRLFSDVSLVTLAPTTYIFAWNSTTTTAALNGSHNGLAAAGGTVYNLNIVNIGTAANPSVAGQLPATLGALTSNIELVPLVLFDQQ